MFQCFVIMLLKWMKYKNRLTFEYYSIRYWDFKRLQSVPKTWQMLKTFLKKLKKTLRNFFERCPITEIPFFMILNPDFSLFFPVFTDIVWCWKCRFPTIFFPKSRNIVLKIFLSRPPANTTPPLFTGFWNQSFLSQVLRGRKL